MIGHSVERLSHQAAKYDHEFENMIAVWSILDGFYIPTRYPNGVPDSIPARVYTKYAAIQASEMADEIMEFVRRKMGEIDRS